MEQISTLHSQISSFPTLSIMEIRTRHYNNVVILSVNGRLDAATAPQLQQAIDEQTYNRLVVDLKQVDYMSSAGIKVLVQATQKMRQQGGDFRIANARAHVKYVLHLAGIHTIIKMYTNVVSATASFFPGPLPEKA